jgi:hypothetical protein
LRKAQFDEVVIFIQEALVMLTGKSNLGGNPDPPGWETKLDKWMDSI